ncbi:Blue-light-activated protein [Roseivivax jejudonensis]|uniref:histidine kinase n=1 Tax=Roseivivax jejudonensis TaxID=1529041 RepID=A0A1X6YQ73_9RHOB|nr:ATP-binding protein [Roseivivax jejudonensis]SLN27438.1 Blue-light-activated protein [Roseivivax jejudonensis]
MMEAELSFAGREAGRPTRHALWALALVFGILCFVLSAVTPGSAISVALIGAGAVFTGAGAVLGVRKTARGRTTPLASADVASVLDGDPFPSVLCSDDLVVRYANPAARRDLCADPGGSLVDCLRERLAHPAALLQRLSDSTAKTGSAAEDVVLGDSAVRVAARAAGPGLTLWRIEEVVAAPSGDAGVAALSVGRRGAILAMNGSARVLLGRRVRALSDLVGRDTVDNGAVHEIATADGRQRIEFRCLSAGPGRTEIALLPAPEAGTMPSTVFETLPIALVTVARDGAILAANREARSLLALDCHEGARLGTLLEGLGRPIAEWIADAAEGRGLNRPEFLRLSRAHRETFLQVALTRTSGGDLLAVMTDATELKTLEAQFVQSQKMQAIGQLAGGVAHDFNNLLTAISGHCDLLLLRHFRGDPAYDDLLQINQNANRAAALVGQLLAFSRKQSMKPELLDLRETLSDLTHLLNRLVGERISLELRHEPALPAIRGDQRQLEQVMMNLVVNARDAMPDGGRILVETERLTLDSPLKRDRAEVEPGDYVVVKVTDTGTGIAPDKVRKVFEPFYTTKRSGEGTGLGLSTVYGIVKQTGGFIFLDSELGVGTTFRLIFPAQSGVTNAAAVPARPAARAQAGPPVTGGVVLLVEDESPVRAFAARGLRLKGFTVLEAENGECALEMLDDPGLEIDLIVSDMIMPGRDGPTWVREARKARPDVGVIFMSGYATDALGASAGDMSNVSFLQKPFSLNKLAEVVQDGLAEASALRTTKSEDPDADGASGIRTGG